MPLYGYNLTSPTYLNAANTLFQDGDIDHIELMIDNFLHYDEKELQKIEAPISLHIMRSKFLETSPDKLKNLARRIKQMTTHKSPLYVSDHILLFSHKGINLPYLQEIDYDFHLQNPDTISYQLNNWINLLGGEVFFENAASLDKRGLLQHTFIKEILWRSSGKTLLDITNLYVSIKNGGTDIENWIDILSHSNVFHIGSYSCSNIDDQFYIDSHDSELSDEFKEFLRYIFRIIKKNKTIYITYERDTNNEITSVKSDINAIKNIWSGNYVISN